MAKSNLTIAVATMLLDSTAPQNKAKGLRVLAGLIRRGVTLPPDAQEAIATALDGYADSLPKSGKKGGTTRRADSFLGLATQALMQELGVKREDAIRLLLDFLSAHGYPAPDASTIRKSHQLYKDTSLCEPETLEGVSRVLTWAKTQRVSA